MPWAGKHYAMSAFSIAVALFFGSAATAVAFDCGNASKPLGPGEKAVLSTSGDPVSISKSWQNQIDHGKDPESLHGGFIGFDCNGDGVADVDSYASPHGALPENAQSNGSADHGVVPIESTAPASCHHP